MSFRSRTLLAIASITATTTLASAADETSLADLLKQLQDLDQQVKIISRKAELSEEAAATKAKSAVSAKADENGFSIGNADKENPFSLKLGILLQLDGRFWLNDNDQKQPTNHSQSNTFLVRRAQPTIDAQLGRHARARVQASFGNTGTLDLQEAWLEVKPVEAVVLTAGRIKTIGVEYRNSSAGLSFAERGLPTNLVPAYDVGVNLGGKVGDIGTWEVGIVNGSPDGATRATDTDDDKDGYIRVALTPFKSGGEELLKGLTLHFGATSGYETGVAPSATANNSSLTGGYRSVSQATIFAYDSTAGSGAFASGARTRIAPALEWYAGPLGLLAEYTSSEQEISRGSREDVAVENTAWQVVASYLLTDDEKSAGGVKPRRAFDPANGQWGAFEIVGRFGELAIDDTVFAPTVAADRFANPTTQVSRAQSFGAGVNWWLNRNLKGQLSYDHTAFDGGGGGTADEPIDRESEEIVVARLQLNY